METSQHLRHDRLERAVYILTNVGLGAIIYERENSRRDNTIEALTKNGVLLIKDATTKKVITMFLPNLNRLRALYQNVTLPPSVFATYRANQHHRDRMITLKLQ